MGKGIRTLLLFTIAIFAYTTSYLPYGQGLMDPLRWILLAFLCVFALSAPRSSPTAFRAGGLKAFVFLFVAVALLSSLWSHIASLRTFQRGVSVAFLAIFIFLALWPRLQKLADYYALTSVLAAAAWLTIAANLLALVVRPAWAIRPYTHAFQGVFGNPNELGMLYAILLPMAVARFHYRPRLTSAALPAVVFVLLLASQSRAGILGAFVGVGAFYAQYYGQKLWIAIVLALMVLAPMVVMRDTGTVLDPVEQSFLRGESNVDQYGSGRLGLWDMAFQRFKERPFAGYGLGTAGDCFMPNGEPFRWHSSFTQTAVELGIIGLFFYFAPMVYSGVKMATYHLADVKSARVRAVAAGLAAAWFAGAVDSFFESWLFSVGNVASLLAWICFAAGMKAVSEASTMCEGN